MMPTWLILAVMVVLVLILLGLVAVAILAAFFWRRAWSGALEAVEIANAHFGRQIRDTMARMRDELAMRESSVSAVIVDNNKSLLAALLAKEIGDPRVSATAITQMMKRAQSRASAGEPLETDERPPSPGSPEQEKSPPGVDVHGSFDG